MIDVIICAYNGHKYIDKAIKSVIKQTIKEQIIITIVNNGSNKDYHEFIDKYIDKIRIQEVTIKKNKGQWHGSQYGIDNTDCEYFTFLDCDDEFVSKTALEKMKKIMDSNSNIVKVKGYMQKNGEKVSPVVMIHATLFRRSFINKYKIRFQNYYYEDVAYTQLVNIYLGQNQTATINDIVYKYNVGISNDSVTSIKKEKRRIINNYFLSFNGAVKHAKKNKIKISKHKYYDFIEFIISYYLIMQQKKSSSEDYSYFLKKLSKFYKRNKANIYLATYTEEEKEVYDYFIKLLSDNNLLT